MKLIVVSLLFSASLSACSSAEVSSAPTQGALTPDSPMRFRVDGVPVPLFGAMGLMILDDSVRLYYRATASGDTQGFELESTYFFPSGSPPRRNPDGSLSLRLAFSEPPSDHPSVPGARLLDASAAGRQIRYIGYGQSVMELRVDPTGLVNYTLTGEYAEETTTRVVRTGRQVTIHGEGRLHTACGVTEPTSADPNVRRNIGDPTFSRNPLCRELLANW